MTMTPDEVDAGYAAMLGAVPPVVGIRRELFNGAAASVATLIETARAAALTNVAIDPRTVQLLQFTVYASKLFELGADVHARAALRAGARKEELLACAQVAWVTGGVPALNLATTSIAKALESDGGSE